MVAKYVRWPVVVFGGGLLMLTARAAFSWPMSSADTARIRMDTAQASVAIATFDAHYRADPRNYVLAGRLADRYMARFAVGANLNDVDRAEAIARRLVREVPRKSGAEARLSQILLARHDFAGAYEAAKRSIAHDSTGDVGWAVLFDVAMSIGNYPGADTALSRLERGTLARQLRHARWLAFHGDIEAAYQKHARACKDIRFSGLRPQVAAWCLTELSVLSLERDGSGPAKNILGLATETQSGYRGALEKLADIAAAERDWERAAALYERIAVDAHPDLYLRLSEVYRELGDTVRALEMETQFLRVATAPGSEALYAHPLAIFLARSIESIDEAADVIRRDMTRRRPVEAFGVLAWVELRRGNLSAALEASMEARAWGSPSPTMDYVHGMVLDALGRHDEAIVLFEHATHHVLLLEPHVRQHLAGY